MGANNPTGTNTLPNGESSPKVIVYPNPVENVLQVDISKKTFSTARIQIVDFSGRTVLEQQLNSSRAQINVEALNIGMHAIRIFLEDEILNYKFVKI